MVQLLFNRKGKLFRRTNEYIFLIIKFQFVEVKQLNTSNDITTYETVNQKRFTVFSLSKNRRKEIKMKNIDEKILMAEEEIKQLQNKRRKLISQQKQEERKKRDKRIYEKGAVFESIFNESRDFTKDEFYQLITLPNIKEIVNQKILKIVEERGQSENKITETQEGVTETEE